ncbi:MAG: hypothetical protein JW720_10010 [Sedimentisphaerales bacterium]|nr:hypothetical protein [Sedimentisphaerales bacterium]
MRMRRGGYSRFFPAAIVFAGLTVYLFRGRLGGPNRFEMLLPFNAFFAAAGCYVLSRRWVSSFAGSVMAGAVYGFGPFTLSLVKYHPLAGLLAAFIPWLFCPAVFGGRMGRRRNRALLAVLPFAAIICFFLLADRYGFYPVPITTKLRGDDLVSFFAPLVMAKRDIAGTTMFGFYHVPTAALVIGCAMLLAARRLHIVALIVLGVALACCGPFLKTSPVMWLTIPVLCCSVMIGAGVQGVGVAGPGDRRWLLAAGFVQAGFAIAALLLATKYFQVFLSLADGYARLFVQTAEMYILGAVTLMITFFIARARLRIGGIRTTLLSAAIGVDILLSASFLIEQLL